MRSMILWLAVFTLTCAPWFVRTAVYAPGHNPVYPKSAGPFKGEYGADFPWRYHVNDDIMEGLEHDPLATLWQSALDPSGQVDGDQKIGGWGPFYNVLCIPAIGFAVLIGIRRRAWLCVALLAAIIIPWLVFPTVALTWSRFVLPVTLAGFVALGMVVKETEPKTFTYKTGWINSNAYWDTAAAYFGEREDITPCTGTPEF